MQTSGDKSKLLRPSIVSATLLTVSLLPSLWRILFYLPRKIDEYEHWHNAYIIAQFGLQPLKNYFEHHPPLFWKALALLFKVGLTANESSPLIVGRILVATAFLASILLIIKFAEKIQSSKGLIAALFFAFIFTVQQNTFVLRPEAFAIPLVIASIIVAAYKLATLYTFVLTSFASGILLGIAIALSPRMTLILILLPFIVVRKNKLELAIKWLCSSAILATITATIAFLPDIRSVWHWVFEFNSALFNYPKFFNNQVAYMHFVGHVGSIIVIAYSALSRLFNTFNIAIIIIIIFASVLSSFSGGISFPFHQNFATESIIAVVAYILLIDSKNISNRLTKLLTPLLMIAILILNIGKCSIEGELIDTNEQRYFIASILKEGDNIYVCPDLRPISKHKPAFFYEILPFPDRHRLKKVLDMLNNPEWAPKPKTIDNIIYSQPKIIDLVCLSPTQEELDKLRKSLGNCYNLLWLSTTGRNGITPVLVKRSNCNTPQ